MIASSAVGLAGSLAVPSLAAPLFCGTFAGMATSNVITSSAQVCMMGIVAAFGLCGLDAKGRAQGVGGKLGLVAQVACSTTVLLTGTVSYSASFFDRQMYDVTDLAAAVPATLLGSLTGAVLTKLFMTVPQFKRISSPVAAASVMGIIAATALPTEWQGPAYAGAFVAMSAPNVLPTRKAVLGAATVAAAAQIALTGVLTGGWGGKLGTAAFLGSYLWARSERMLAFCTNVLRHLAFLYSGEEPNLFEPRNFEIKCEVEGTCAPNGNGALRPGHSLSTPSVLLHEEGARLHFLQDITFREPKASVFLLLRSPDFSSSAAADVKSTIYQALLADALQVMLDEAGRAGFTTGVYGYWEGLSLSATGYDDTLPKLVHLMAKQLRTFVLTEDSFEGRRAAYLRRLENFERQKPIDICSYKRAQLLEDPYHGIDELRHAAESLTLDEMGSFQSTLLASSDLEALAMGNLKPETATAILRKLQVTVPSNPLSSSDRARMPMRLRQLPVGTTLVQQSVSPKEDERSSALEFYYQIGPESDDSTVLLIEIIEMVFELRTKQFLNAIDAADYEREAHVGDAAVELVRTAGVLGLVVKVSSSVLVPAQLEERLNGFLNQFRSFLTEFGPGDLELYQREISRKYVSVDGSLEAKATRLWGEVSRRRFDFDRPARLVRVLETIDKEQLIAFFDEHIAEGAPQLRRLSTHVYRASDAPRQLLDLSEFQARTDFWPTQINKDGPDAPPPSCNEQGQTEPGSPRRFLEAHLTPRRGLGGAVAAEDWQAAWRTRLECWFLGLPLPTQTQLGSCMGALALHLGSKLDASWRAAQLALGRTPTAMQQIPAREGIPETGCEWVRGGGLEMPAIPDLPGDLPSDFRLPPLPQLLPTWQRLQSLVNWQRLQPRQQQQSTPAWQAAGLGAGVGLGLGAVLVLAIACNRRRPWMCRVRVRRQAEMLTCK